MAAIVGGLCMEGLWRGWRFTMIGMKKLQDINLKFSAGSVFPDAIKYNLILNTFHKICIQISSSEA